MKEKLNIIRKILNVVVVLFVVMFLLMVILQRFSNNALSLFNYRMFTVASGSMAPQYQVGDVLVAKETPPEKIKVGDSITYLGTRGTFAGKVVTHEVTSIEKDVDGNFVFHTKGIANLVEDPPVYKDQIYGVIVWHPKILSFIYKVINTKYGLFLFIVLPIFYMIGSELLTAMLEMEDERRKKAKESKIVEEKVIVKDEKIEDIKEMEKEEPKEELKEEPKEEINQEIIEVEIEEKPKRTRQTKTTSKTTTKKTTSTAAKKTIKKETTTTKKEVEKKETTPKTKSTTKKEPVKKETTKKSTSTKKKETK